MLQLFHTVSQDCSRIVTEKYSTSFASAIRLLHRSIRTPIYNIYGFVRFADEVVDTFHEQDQAVLMKELKTETYNAFERRLSLNPILNSFQQTVHEYKIDITLVEAFFRSMELDLTKKKYNHEEYSHYVYGSAESVGLMCLTVFCEGDEELYEKLKTPAQTLGSAFQKVNFLRDLKADYTGLSRVYFPECDFDNFTISDKQEIESEIQKEFDFASQGILQLPVKARFGVYVAYKYYLSLFKKIKKTEPAKILEERIRIPDYHKALILFNAGIKNQLRLI
ncbi:MAG TPA: squalene/phytoene synthase family protein [Chitinophagaceae bacterium]|nr:squalene/phytoene synthase family protein [Chitinophagaceae bacterium]